MLEGDLTYNEGTKQSSNRVLVAVTLPEKKNILACY